MNNFWDVLLEFETRCRSLHFEATMRLMNWRRAVVRVCKNRSRTEEHQSPVTKLVPPFRSSNCLSRPDSAFDSCLVADWVFRTVNHVEQTVSEKNYINIFHV